MQKAAFRRQYVILRPTQGCAGGFARLESHQGRGCITIQVNQVEEPALRALLMGGTGPDAALLDLGVMPITAQGRGAMYRDGLTAEYTGCHTLLICRDWPEPHVLLCGYLTAAPACPLQTMQESVADYLAVPAGDTVLPAAAPPAPAAKAETMLCRLSPPSEALQGCVLRLPHLLWPAPLAELAGYFTQYPPCAPFDAPGWRFVRVPLAHSSPAPWCEVGIHIRGHRVLEAAYALPGEASEPAPAALPGCRWMDGRHAQGYWVARSGEMDAPPP
ncbi:MAG: hypothetical protein ACI4MJ_08245 [Aristaeellaceae bacterium]